MDGYTHLTLNNIYLYGKYAFTSLLCIASYGVMVSKVEIC